MHVPLRFTLPLVVGGGCRCRTDKKRRKEMATSTATIHRHPDTLWDRDSAWVGCLSWKKYFSWRTLYMQVVVVPSKKVKIPWWVVRNISRWWRSWWWWWGGGGGVWMQAPVSDDDISQKWGVYVSLLLIHEWRYYNIITLQKKADL